MRVTLSFNEEALYEPIFEYNKPATVYDLLNPGAFVGNRAVLALEAIVPWYSDMAIVSDGDAVVYPEFFAVSLAASTINAYSRATSINTSFADELKRVVKKRYSDYESLLCAGNDFLLSTFLQENYAAVEEIKDLRWHRLRRMMSTGNEVWLNFESVDQRAIAYEEMERKESTYGQSEFIPVTKRTFDIQSSFRWTRDVENVRRHRQATDVYRPRRSR